MTQEELIQLLSVDNCEEINSEELPVEDYMTHTYLLPNVPTFLEAVLKIDGMVLVCKSEQWLYMAYTKDIDTPEASEVAKKIYAISFALVAHIGVTTYEEGVSHSTMMEAYNNNPIDLTTI